MEIGNLEYGTIPKEFDDPTVDIVIKTQIFVRCRIGDKGVKGYHSSPEIVTTGTSDATIETTLVHHNAQVIRFTVENGDPNWGF